MPKKKPRGKGRRLVDVTDKEIVILSKVKPNTFCKTGIKTGLFLRYHNKDYVLKVMEQQKINTISQAINFIIEKMAKMEEINGVVLAETETTRDNNDEDMDMFEWLTS